MRKTAFRNTIDGLSQRNLPQTGAAGALRGGSSRRKQHAKPPQSTPPTDRDRNKMRIFGAQKND